MTLQPTITFRHMGHSDAVAERISERMQRLDRFPGKVTSCRVVVESPHQHKRQGQLFAIRIQAHYPGGELEVTSEGPNNHAHEDVYVAIRDAFNALERRLERVLRRQDHGAHAHEVPSHGKIVSIDPNTGYGFIETSDGVEVYFHRNTVTIGRFEDLKPGAEVRVEYGVQESVNGPQATTVKPIGKHHPIDRM